MSKPIRIVIYVNNPGRVAEKKLERFTDDLCDVIEKHFYKSGYTVSGGYEPEVKQ